MPSRPVLVFFEDEAYGLHDHEAPLELLLGLTSQSISVECDESSVAYCEDMTAATAAVNRVGHVRAFAALCALEPCAEFLVVCSFFDQFLVALWAEQSSLDQEVVHVVYVAACGMF